MANNENTWTNLKAGLSGTTLRGIDDPISLTSLGQGSYTRTVWVNGETSLSAANLNNIEDGIEQALTPATSETDGAMSAEDKAKLDSIWEIIYPVGSIYMSTASTSPAVLFGGTWAKVEGRFLLGTSSSYALNSTGGSANAIIPYHNHSVASSGYIANGITGGSHSHNQQGWFGVTAGGSSAVKECRARHKVSGDASDASTNVASTHTHNLPNHTHTVNYTGVSTTGANMPPYLAVNIWRRTA